MPPALQNPITLWLLLTAALAGLVYAFMRQELRVRAIGYGAFLLACVVAVWPPYEREGAPGKIHLGLDLKGGMHLVLQVVVEDALNATVDDAVTTARDQATRKGIQLGPVARVLADLVQHRGRRAGARQGHARPAARLLPQRLGGARAGRGRLQGGDDRSLPAPAQGPDGAGDDPHARAPRQRARASPSRVIAAQGGSRRPDPGPAARRHRRRAGQAHDQDDRPALAQARRDVGRDARDAARRHGRPRAGQHGSGLGPRRHAGRARLLPAAQGGPDHRARPQDRPRRGGREQPPADQLLAERHGDRQVRARNRPQHQPPARDRARRHRRLGAR